ncbi:Trk system potassium transporter TrkA, partial [Tamlana crocina]|nr:Trk system potassium transporter TrkA [Tamlana crocina]
EEIGFTQFGIDELISPEALAAREIELLLNQSAFNDSYEFEDGALTMVGLTLTESAAFVGRTVKETAKIFPGIHFMPIAMRRRDTSETIIPRGN